ncbi:MAG: FCD domain-containing protein [Pseudomonadota bacterium]
MNDAKTLFQPLAQAPAYKRLCHAIEAEIMGGRLQPGELLPTESALAEAFALNRSTVREGIRLLEQSGLVERSSGRRLTVARPSTEDLGARFSQALVLHAVTFQELWQTVAALEPAAAAYAAEARQPEDIQALTENLAASREAAGQGEAARLAELDVAFHAAVAKAAHNRALLLAREAVGGLFYPAFALVVTRLDTAADRLLTAHQAVADAIVAGDAAEARRWMDRHIADFHRGFCRVGLDPHAPITALTEEADA